MKNIFYVVLCFVFLDGIVAQENLNCWPEGFTHDTHPDKQWLSCTSAQNPNGINGESVWLQYDFGFVYSLGSAHFWNYNVPGELDYGIKTLRIDYSIDGVGWTHWGNVELDKATGQRDYAGEAGPEFGGILARYLVITVLDYYDPDQNCAGIAAVRFDLDQLVSAEDDLETASLQVFPNPSSGVFSLKLSDGNSIKEISLYTMTGVPILVLPIGRSAFELDLQYLPPGVYQLNVQDQQGRKRTELLSLL